MIKRWKSQVKLILTYADTEAVSFMFSIMSIFYGLSQIFIPPSPSMAIPQTDNFFANIPAWVWGTLFLVSGLLILHGLLLEKVRTYSILIGINLFAWLYLLRIASIIFSVGYTASFVQNAVFVMAAIWLTWRILHG